MSRKVNLINGNFITLDHKCHNAEMISVENGKIADRNDFMYLVRSAYGDDVKQYFLAVTQSGLIYASDDLETWKQQGDINLD